MRLQSWLATTTSISDSSSSSHKSLQSNMSLQTLPSIPTLTSSFSDNLNNNNLNNNNLFVTNTTCLSSLKQPHPIASLAITPDHLLVASGHLVLVYHKKALTLLHTLRPNPSSGAVKSLAVNSNGDLLTAHQDSKIRVWSTKTTPFRLLNALPTLPDRLKRLVGHVTTHRHVDAVSGIAVSSDGATIYSVSWDKTLKAWGASDFRCAGSVNAHDDAVNAVAVSSDGAVYTGSADKRIRVWATPENNQHKHKHKHGTLVLVATLEKHKSAVNALALSDDGSVLFSGACDRSILVWAKNDGVCHMAVVGALRGHEGSVLSLVHVAGFLFSGSADRTVRMWVKGRDERYCCLTVLEGHEKPVRSLAAERERDGVVLVTSGSLGGEVKVWEVSFSSIDGFN